MTTSSTHPGARRASSGDHTLTDSLEGYSHAEEQRAELRERFDRVYPGSVDGQYFVLLASQAQRLSPDRPGAAALLQYTQALLNSFENHTLNRSDVYDLRRWFLEVAPIDEVDALRLSLRARYYKIADNDERANYDQTNPPPLNALRITSERESSLLGSIPPQEGTSESASTRETSDTTTSVRDGNPYQTQGAAVPAPRQETNAPVAVQHPKDPPSTAGDGNRAIPGRDYDLASQRINSIRFDAIILSDLVAFLETRRPFQEEMRDRVIRQLCASLVLVMGFASITGIFVANHFKSFPLLAIVAIAGAIGATVSAIRRLQASFDEAGTILMTTRYLPIFLSICLAPPIGALFGIILVLVLFSGLLPGDIMAGGDKMETPHWLMAGYTAPSLARIIVCAFVAGFAERLVPDTLDRLCGYGKKQ